MQKIKRKRGFKLNKSRPASRRCAVATGSAPEKLAETLLALDKDQLIELAVKLSVRCTRATNCLRDIEGALTAGHATVRGEEEAEALASARAVARHLLLNTEVTNARAENLNLYER